MKAASGAFALALISLMAGSVLAQPPEGGGRGPGGRGPGGFGGPGFGPPGYERLSDALGKLDLTSEQKDKIEALKKEYGPKAKALREKMEALQKESKALFDEARPEFADVLTDDQKETLKKALSPRGGRGGWRGGRGQGGQRGPDGPGGQDSPGGQGGDKSRDT